MIYLLHQGLQIILIYLIGEILIDKDLNSLQFISNGLLKWILFIIIIIKALTI